MEGYLNFLTQKPQKIAYLMTFVFFNSGVAKCTPHSFNIVLPVWHKSLSDSIYQIKYFLFFDIYCQYRKTNKYNIY